MANRSTFDGTLTINIVEIKKKMIRMYFRSSCDKTTFYEVMSSAKIWKAQIEIPQEIYLNGTSNVPSKTTKLTINQVLN